MDERTKENWLKVKKALEETGKTDCFFYKQACRAVSDRPLEEPLGSNYGLRTELS